MECRKCKKTIPEASVFCCWCGVKQTIPPHKPKARSNGEGSVYMQNKRWKAEVSYYINGQRCRATKAGFATKREALEALPALREAALVAKEQSHDATIAQLWTMLQEKWLPTLSKDKQSHYRTAYGRLSAIQNINIRKLRYADLQPIIDELGVQFYPARDVKALLHRMYDTALKYEYADRDYAELLDLPPMKASVRRALTVEEIERIWADYNAGHGTSKYFLIMAYTAMRTGEIRTLPKSNVHLSKQYAIGGIKTDAGKNREIVFCDRILPLVREAYHENTDRLCEIPEDAFYYAWREMCSRTEIKDADPYCLRHTAASLLAAEGVAPVIIQQILGHSSYSITANTYTHVSVDEKLAAVNKLK